MGYGGGVVFKGGWGGKRGLVRKRLVSTAKKEGDPAILRRVSRNGAISFLRDVYLLHFRIRSYIQYPKNSFFLSRQSDADLIYFSDFFYFHFPG